jgi:flagellar L-ring protein precursor FlgH
VFNMKQQNFYLTLFGFSFLILSGCTTHKMEPRIDFKPPKYVEEMPAREEDSMEPYPGSLFGRGKNPLFSDRKAMQVNDVLTVRISEATTASSTLQKNLAKTNDATLGGGVFTGSGISAINTGTNMTMQTSSTSAYTGTGASTRDDKFQTTITARVIKILSNGNYFIDGSRELLINGEKQIIKVSGVVSPYNITASNEIDSKYISDAKIQYLTEGELEQGTQQGWMARFFNAIWPF